MANYESLADAISDLRERGYTNTFTIQNSSIYCTELEEEIDPESLTIVERYEVEAYPPNDETRGVYGITMTNGDKGILLDTYADYDKEEFTSLVKRIHRNIQK